jgi:hypothetical protein
VKIKNKNFNYNIFSNWGVTNNSVLHRSISVPLNFLFYIINLSKTINGKPKPTLIADDASIAFSNSNLDDFKMI